METKQNMIHMDFKNIYILEEFNIIIWSTFKENNLFHLVYNTKESNSKNDENIVDVPSIFFISENMDKMNQFYKRGNTTKWIEVKISNVVPFLSKSYFIFNGIP